MTVELTKIAGHFGGALRFFVKTKNPFLKMDSYLNINQKFMDPPKTKKQTIKNQKEKGASEHRLGTAKHIRLAEARKRNK